MLIQDQISLSMPMVSESTYKPVWAKQPKNSLFLSECLANPSLEHLATSTRGGNRHNLYRVKISQFENFYFVHDIFNGQDSIVYGVRVVTFNIKGLKEFTTLGQVSVWRNKTYSFLPVGFAKWIFIGALYPIYNSIVSDNSQSSAGKTFWYETVGEQLDEGIYVYALGLENVKPHVCNLEEIHPISNIRQLDNYYSVAPDTRGHFYRILMSKRPLT